MCEAHVYADQQLAAGYANYLYGFQIDVMTVSWSSWRNRLARSTVNRKVGGSSPPEDDHILFVSYCIY